MLALVLICSGVLQLLLLMHLLFVQVCRLSRKSRFYHHHYTHFTLKSFEVEVQEQQVLQEKKERMVENMKS